MAEFGVAAGIVGVLGFTGQAIRGCIFLKSLIDQIKDAPAEIESVRTQLDLVVSTISNIERHQSEARRANIDVVDASPYIKHCHKAVSALERHIQPSFESFHSQPQTESLNLTPDSDVESKNTRRRWRRLKVALEAPKTRELIVKLEQAKTQLVGVQATMIHTISLRQNDLLKGLGISTTTLQASQADSATTLRQTHDAIQQTLDLVRDVDFVGRSTIGNIQTTTEEIRMLHQRSHANIENLSAQISSATTQTIASVEGLRNELQNSFLTPFLLSQIDRAVERFAQHQLDQKNPQYQSSRSSTDSRQISQQIKLPNGCGSLTSNRSPNVCDQKSYRAVSSPKVYYWHGIYRISVVEVSSHRISCLRKRSHTNDKRCANQDTDLKLVIDVQSSLKFLQKGFQFIISTSKLLFNPGIGMHLRAYSVVPWWSPVINVIEQGNLAGLKSLFAAGVASPFDIREYNGHTLLDTALTSLSIDIATTSSCCSASKLQIMEFLIEQGCRWGYKLKPAWIPHVLRDIVHGPQIVRLVLAHCEYNPFEDESTSIYITAKTVGLPAYGALIQQDYWVVDLQNHSFQASADGSQSFQENDRMILMDIDGFELNKALGQGFKYSVYCPIPPNRFSFWDFEHSLHGVLYIFALSDRNNDMRQACINRLAHLICFGLATSSWLPRSSPENKQFIAWGTPTAIAKAFDVVEVWKSGLRKGGKSDADINDIFDEEEYFSVPKLLDGRIYTTMRENCELFYELLVTGQIGIEKVDPIASLSHGKWIDYIHCSPDPHSVLRFGYEVLNMARDVKQAVAQKSMPGGWVEHEELRLVPGVDFRIAGWWWTRWWKTWHDKDDEDYKAFDYLLCPCELLEMD
ncbi:hypothetical protein IFR05_004563 [Cadophora sp. M221]|nr:hypothetical protein IFR05_004563 [Cadophora sp. M221]